MLRTIHLHGALGERFGGPYRFAVETPAEALMACRTQLPGFSQAIAQGHWHIVAGTSEHGREVAQAHLALGLGEHGEVHFIPAIEGAKSGASFGKIALGVALVGVGLVMAPAGAAGGLALGAEAFSVLGTSITYGNIVLMGAAMALTGVTQLLAGSPRAGSYADREEGDKRQGFVYNGPINVTAQGQPIPLVFGRVRVGSIVVAAGLHNEKVAEE